MTRKRITVRLTEELSTSIENVTRKNGATQNQVINNAIEYYFEHEGVDYPELMKVMEEGFRLFYEPIGEELKRIRHIQNELSKASQMNLEFWNDYFLHQGDGTLVTTDVKKSNEFSQAEANIKNRILEQQQQKHS